MQNIIDYTYFRTKLVLANVQVPGDSQDYLTQLITDLQTDFLTELLGPSLYSQFDTWYTTLPQDQTNPFYHLLIGKTFVFNGEMVYWKGLKSVFAQYVYYTYQELDATQTVSGGEVKTKSQNASNASSVQKMVTACIIIMGIFLIRELYT